ncbi:MAG TPA: EthD family reductase [Vicinamibacterales bacterium]|nr:EthD family reductase [Vicinamibacterales bacterium]
MIKVSVLYPAGAGKKFDMSYYLTSHMPMVGRKLGAAMKGMSVDEGIGTAPPGTQAPFVAVAHLMFDSLEAYGAAFAQHGADIMADVPNYTDIQPVVQISQIRM